MSSFKSILNELRMPDFNYQFEKSLSAYERAFRGYLCRYISDQPDMGLVAYFKSLYPQQDLPVLMFNSLYVADRILDGFLRKNTFADELTIPLGLLRAGLAFDMSDPQEAGLAEDTPLIVVMALLEGVWNCWSPEPKRLAETVIKQFALLVAIAERPALYREALLVQIKDLASWTASQGSNREKVLSRLHETERGAALARASLVKAVRLINEFADGNSLPSEVIDFLSGPWLDLLRLAGLTEVNSDTWDTYQKLTRTIVWAFTGNGNRNREALFGVGETLTDQLAACFVDKRDVNDYLELFNQLLIFEIQGVQTPKISFDRLSCDFELDESERPDEGYIQAHVAHWFVFKSVESASRVLVSDYLEATNEFLLVNSAGMKSALVPYTTFKNWIDQQILMAVSDVYSIREIVSETERGLTKVASAQMAARLRAKEKAELEAALLRKMQEEARLKAEAEARYRAELQKAAMRRAEEEAKRQSEKLAEERKEDELRRKLELEQQTLETIDNIKLGAWVELRVNDELMRMKLAVRINATDKLIFVDRMGLRRQEVKREELMARLIEGAARVLSDGAEFAETLERVVGRIRVGK
ncbi:MAG: DUF1631 family protein [Hahellaceae bacterium]|nr:DUF1631 family protein [Hahellaceae bacterium]